MLKPALALLTTIALPAMALAQAPNPPVTAAGSTGSASPDASGQVAPMDSSTPLPPADGSLQALEDQIHALQQQVEGLKKEVAQVQPSWKGAPQFSGNNGFTFKPKGYFQFDGGYVSTPGRVQSGTFGGLNYNDLGWNTISRRIVIGAQGTLPGGFGYNVELNLAQGTVNYEDIVLTYQRKDSPIQITAGNFYPLSSLETMTSSKYTSFMERASAFDAFGIVRRVGVAVGLNNKADTYTLTAGVFNQPINDANYNHTGWQASVRGTYAPHLGENTRLHLGVNFQHRETQKDAQFEQYRSRPFMQTTDQRFIDTGLIAAKGDDILGGEFAVIHGPLHVAGEYQKDWVRGYHNPLMVFDPNNGAPGALFYSRNPSFESAYGEVGFFLTGETRQYKGGRWDRVKVLHPFDQGGIGAIQLNARFDYDNLDARTGNGGTLAAPDYINGGKQYGYELDLIWNPIDYVRFMAQYGRGHYVGGPRAATIDPLSTDPINDRTYNVNTAGFRAQIEF